jgi:photosystem II stability/assembly factor-like uncharacterized protein
MRSVWATVSLLALALGSPTQAQHDITIAEIGPTQSSLDPSDPDGASGGRVNGLATVAGTDRILYAASEWGGLWKSTDAGRTWSHLNGHVPTATWDVEVDPGNENRVYATSFYDGRVDSRAGISVSTNAGSTWTKPASASPPRNFCDSEVRREEPSAFGIAIDPSNPNNVYVGTNCGLAISTDRGGTWRYVDPTPADGADDVWDVVLHHGGIIDLCGQDGHRRSTDGGATWTTATGANRLPSGRCSIAASPDEAHVLFAVVGTTIYESDDGGATWLNRYTNPSPQGRIPFVATNKRDGRAYDLWFGDVRLYRGTCQTPATPGPGGAQRCQASASWAGPFTRSAGGHDDVGDIAFDSRTATNACPVLFSSDGGVYFNTQSASPACHTPAWEQPNRTPRAVWNWDMAGVRRTGTTPEDVYFGNQDNGSFGTTDAGAAVPTWNNQRCCDGFDVAADSTRALSTICCFGGGRSTRLFVSNPGLTGGGEINTYPAGNLRGFQQLDSIATFGPNQYAVISSSGVFLTDNIGANPVVWRQIGAATSPASACGIRVSRSGSTVMFFVKNGGCDGDVGGTLWRYTGTASSGTWSQVTRGGAGQFGVYDVDTNNPNRIIASDLGGPSGPEMVMTANGGTTWTKLTQLDALMTGNGDFRYQTRMGPRRFTSLTGYPQPTLVAFDPADRDVIVAAAADAGVFASIDGGTNWKLLTDPNNPDRSGVAHIPRARHAHFEHDEPEVVRVYLGTQGRGVWRVSFRKTPEVLKRHYIYTTLRVTNSGSTRGCGYANWSCMTGLCRSDLGSSAWRGWAGCHKSGSSWLCVFECGMVRETF